MEQQKVLTICGSNKVKAALVQVGASTCWIWPPEAVSKIKRKWEERRNAAFTVGVMAGQYLGVKKNRKREVLK